MNWQISEYGVRRIARYEGFSGKSYTCAGGKVTIGFGHVIKEKEVFTEISVEDGLEILRQDCSVAEAAVNRLVKVDVNQGMFDVLVSFVFNVGSGNFARSSVLRHLNNGDYYQAAEALTLWVNVGGKPLAGLIKRRTGEALDFMVSAVMGGFIKGSEADE